MELWSVSYKGRQTGEFLQIVPLNFKVPLIEQSQKIFFSFNLVYQKLK